MDLTWCSSAGLPLRATGKRSLLAVGAAASILSLWAPAAVQACEAALSPKIEGYYLTLGVQCLGADQDAGWSKRGSLRFQPRWVDRSGEVTAFELVIVGKRAETAYRESGVPQLRKLPASDLDHEVIVKVNASVEDAVKLFCGCEVESALKMQGAPDSTD